ncbi:MAG: hypothetical protein EOM91_21410, partial [Sphingobacteriia bacterium]|nr:hypothetical protein [Sphingobacteriia bacterium]
MNRYIIRTDEPFRGSVQSLLSPDGTVEWSGGLTVEQYIEERGFPVRVVDRAELEALIADYEAGQVTEPESITEDQWTYALGVLPPSRWGLYAGVELFHICERISGELVSWYAHLNGRYWSFVDLS